MTKKLLFILLIALLIPTLFCRADLVRDTDQLHDDLEIFGGYNHTSYPKLANLFYRWHIEESEVEKLARYDILLIDMEVQIYSPDKLKEIKKINPNIVLLAYLAPEEIRGDSGSMSGTLRQKLYKKIDSSWWLKDDKGTAVAWWEPNPMINITAKAPTKSGKRWPQVLAEFIKNEIINTGYWDGVFYDNVWNDISFLSHLNIDLDQNGSKDSISSLNTEWRNGMKVIFEETRKLLGSRLIFGNGGEYYASYLNGVLYENFPRQGWKETLSKYNYINKNGKQPSAGIINTNVFNSGNNKDYQKMRFGLASTLMGNGYHSFDNGDQSHHEVWWYDEYEVSLGNPASDPYNVLNNNKQFESGLWRRDFKNGLVLVNSTDQERSVELGGEYEKIRGTQDPYTNDGFLVEKVYIPANDGLILLRPVAKILNATYFNGSFARVFNRYGNVSRSGFFAYDERFRGGNQVIEADINKDGKKEFVVADINKVEIYDNNGKLLTYFYPYTENYNQGVNITIGDLDNNGTMEIITGTEMGGGPHVRIFNSDGKLINPGFFAYADSFRGGVNITVGDMEGDGYLEIIAGAGVGGGPHVRIFAADGKLINPGFFAYDKSFRGGVNVAVGDVDGDGVDEIVTGPGAGGQPHIKIFNKKGILEWENFFAFDQTLRDGVEVAVSDMDGDGEFEIIGTTRDVFTISGN